MGSALSATDAELNSPNEVHLNVLPRTSPQRYAVHRIERMQNRLRTARGLERVISRRITHASSRTKGRIVPIRQYEQIAEGTLESLPAELLHIILESLDALSMLCLASTSTRLRDVIATKTFILTKCESWLFLCRLEEGSKDRQMTRLTCNYCKTTHPPEKFVASRIEQAWQNRKIDNARVFQSPLQRYCWKTPLRTSWMSPYRRYNVEPRLWVQRTEFTCLHCRSLVGTNDRRATGCWSCRCNTCPRTRLPTYLRYGPPIRKALLPTIVSLERDKTNHLWIKESCGRFMWKSFLVEEEPSGPWTVQSCWTPEPVAKYNLPLRPPNQHFYNKLPLPLSNHGWVNQG